MIDHVVHDDEKLLKIYSDKMQVADAQAKATPTRPVRSVVVLELLRCRANLLDPAIKRSVPANEIELGSQGFIP